ncbi:MAG TPA: Ig-like domain-containing protein, partial [Gemmatimonadaceae bacterium]|nr:Ig-like domain-containing protein [Gemmatimonadaceae bacterium]
MTRLLRSALTLLFVVAPLGAQQAPAAPAAAADLPAEIRGASIAHAHGMSSLVAGRIALTIGESRVLRVAPGQQLELPLRIDPASAGANVASLTTALTWDATRLTLDSVLASGVGSLTPNTSNAASGSLALSWLNPTGSTSQVTVARLFFTASATSGGTTLLMAPSALGSESAGNLLSQAVARQTQACVAPPGNWGDVNGDGNVNIIDAQQIARYSVSLDVARPELVTSQGDVSADDAVNILDAQQIARSAVGLSAAARIGQVAFTLPTLTTVAVTPSAVQMGVGAVQQFVASPRSAGDVAWDGCVATTWSSSSSAATVDTAGIVSGVSDGDVTITATAGGVQGTSAV